MASEDLPFENSIAGHESRAVNCYGALPPLAESEGAGGVKGRIMRELIVNGMTWCVLYSASDWQSFRLRVIAVLKNPTAQTFREIDKGTLEVEGVKVRLKQGTR